MHACEGTLYYTDEFAANTSPLLLSSTIADRLTHHMAFGKHIALAIGTNHLNKSIHTTFVVREFMVSVGPATGYKSTRGQIDSLKSFV